MKNKIFGITLLILGFNCSQKKELTLLESVSGFTVSECRNNCSIDSVGIRRNEVDDGDLYLRFGYFLNCSWEEAYIDAIEERNDTMIIHVDRPFESDTVIVKSGDITTEEITYVYPETSCDCFFFFDVKIKAVENAPKVVRISQNVGEVQFWDQEKNNQVEKKRKKAYIGMPLDALMTYLDGKKYREEEGIITLYSGRLIVTFFHKDSIVTNIKANRQPKND